MHLLHIDASARSADSNSRQLSARIAEQLAPASTSYRDLANPLPHIDETWVGATFTPPEHRSPEQAAALALSDTLVAELQAADTLVIGLPLYNFAIPSTLKAWIDHIARVGVTFRYTEAGPEGLLTGKRAIIVVAAGGVGLGSDADHASAYLRQVLGFVGITDVTFVDATGLAMDADTVLASANQAIGALAA